jgi:hypothetical protein
MLTKDDISLVETKLVTKKDMKNFKIELKETLDKYKKEIITEIRKVRKIVQKWK